MNTYTWIGTPLVNHPQNSRALKGAYNLCPPKQRYSGTWKVLTVITWLDTHEINSLHDWSFSQICTVIVLTRHPLWSPDLAGLSYTSLRYIPEDTVFSADEFAKQSCAGWSINSFLPQFCLICAQSILWSFTLKKPRLIEDFKSLFTTAVGKHHPAASATIVRWIKAGPSKTGVDIHVHFQSLFYLKCCYISCDKCRSSVTKIMEAANWTSANVFEKFYYRPSWSSTFRHTVISSASNLQSWYGGTKLLEI